MADDDGAEKRELLKRSQRRFLEEGRIDFTRARPDGASQQGRGEHVDVLRPSVGCQCLVALSFCYVISHGFSVSAVVCRYVVESDIMNLVS